MRTGWMWIAVVAAGCKGSTRDGAPADGPPGSHSDAAGDASIDARVDAAIDATIDAALDAPIDASSVTTVDAALSSCTVTANGTLTIEFSSASYGAGDHVVACGHAPANSAAIFQVFEPIHNNFVAIEQLNADGSGLYQGLIFTFPMAPTSTYSVGTYTVRISDGTQTQGTVEWNP